MPFMATPASAIVCHNGPQSESTIPSRSSPNQPTIEPIRIVAPSFVASPRLRDMPCHAAPVWSRPSAQIAGVTHSAMLANRPISPNVPMKGRSTPLEKINQVAYQRPAITTAPVVSRASVGAARACLR